MAVKRYRSKVVPYLLILVLGVAVWLSPFFVLASGVGNPVISITNPPSGDASSRSSGEIYTMCNSVNNTIWNMELFKEGGKKSEKKIPFLTYKLENNVVNITVDMNTYGKLNGSAKQKVMQAALDGVYNSSISHTNRNKIYSSLCELDETTSSMVRQLSTDVRSDFYKAYSIFKPFSGLIGTLMGVIVIALFVLLGLTSVIDIAYITLPMVQLILGDASSGKTKFVSYEAVCAVKEMESSQGKISALGRYAKTKTKQYVAIILCILYLASGEIFNLIAQAIEMFSGILG